MENNSVKAVNFISANSLLDTATFNGKDYKIEMTRKPLVLNENKKFLKAVEQAITNTIVYKLDSSIHNFKKSIRDFYAKKNIGTILNKD